MSSSSEITVKEISVEMLYQHSIESSEDPPMAEWSSFILPEDRVNPKRELHKKGLYDPGSGEICGKYIAMSCSSVLRHVYYNYPANKDPGIEDALLKPEPKKIYPLDGQELYLDICKETNLIPVRPFHRGMQTDAIDLKTRDRSGGNAEASTSRRYDTVSTRQEDTTSSAAFLVETTHKDPAAAFTTFVKAKNVVTERVAPANPKIHEGTSTAPANPKGLAASRTTYGNYDGLVAARPAILNLKDSAAVEIPASSHHRSSTKLKSTRKRRASSLPDAKSNRKKMP